VLDSGSRANGRCKTDHSVTAPAANPTAVARVSRAANLLAFGVKPTRRAAPGSPRRALELDTTGVLPPPCTGMRTQGSVNIER
jgi:hypothetical protein